MESIAPSFPAMVTMLALAKPIATDRANFRTKLMLVFLHSSCPPLTIADSRAESVETKILFCSCRISDPGRATGVSEGR